MPNAAVQEESTPFSSCRQPLVSDEAWALIAPLLPVAAATGRPRKWALRTLLEAIVYLLRTGCQWRALPEAFPPYSTVQRHFYEWRDCGLFERINHLLVMLDREREGREASPSAGVIDSQSVKTSETGGTKGYDAGKKIMGLKRHILVDTAGRLLSACVSAADMHDSRVAPHLLRASRRSWPFIQKIWADSAYRGERVAAATPIQVEIEPTWLHRSETPMGRRAQSRVDRSEPTPRQGLRTAGIDCPCLHLPRRRLRPHQAHHTRPMNFGSGSDTHSFGSSSVSEPGCSTGFGFSVASFFRVIAIYLFPQCSRPERVAL